MLYVPADPDSAAPHCSSWPDSHPVYPKWLNSYSIVNDYINPIDSIKSHFNLICKIAHIYINTNDPYGNLIGNKLNILTEQYGPQKFPKSFYK